MSRSALVKQITVSIVNNAGVMGRRWIVTTSKDGDSDEEKSAPKGLPAHLLAPPASSAQDKAQARRPYKRPSFSTLVTEESPVAAGQRRWWPPIDDDPLDQVGEKPLEHE